MKKPKRRFTTKSIGGKKKLALSRGVSRGNTHEISEYLDIDEEIDDDDVNVYTFQN